MVLSSRARRTPFAVAALLAAISPVVQAVDDVTGGTLFTLTNSATSPNGAWCWFQDQRAIIDRSTPGAPKLVLSSVSSSATASENGDVDLLWRDLSTGTQGEFELYNQLEADDHDAAAFYIRPDGRYVAMYSRHTSDLYTHYRVSTNPHDPTAWGADQVITNAANATYDNIYYLPADRGGLGRLYNFTRSVGWDPNLQTSTDQGNNWSLAGRLLTEGGDGDRPYVQYKGNGSDKIWFVTTDRHPDNYANNLYVGYVSDGTLYNTGGTTIDSNLFDGTAVAPSALSRIFTNGSVINGTTENRAWSDNIVLDKAKNPVIVFQTCANDSRTDHRFFYARFDGADWQVSEMAKAGGYLYSGQQNYTGLCAIDPDNPNVVYMSSTVNPLTSSSTSKYEIYKGVTADFGKTWTWSAVTSNSTVDNIRPVVPEWDGSNTALLWMRGTYASYTSWTTEMVGLSLTDSGAKSSVWRGDAAGATTLWNKNTSPNWDTGGGLAANYADGDEVTFDDTASSANVNIVSTVNPMNIAFNNRAKSYTLSGAAIGGAASVRVIGGGAVTLANATNTYTGDTRVAYGRLALTGSTTLSGTSQIRIDSRGTLDVSGATGGTYAMVGRKLTVDGKVVGNLLASASATITGNTSSSFQGNVAVNASTLSGTPTITGHLTAQSGGLIRVGETGIAATTSYTPVTYTDATPANTQAYDAATYPGASWKIDVASPATGTADNLWDQRTTFGTNGNIISSNNGTAEDAPLIKTTVSGLNPGQSYQVLGYFWNANGVNWQIKATTRAADIQTNSTATLADDYLPSNPTVMFSASGTATSTNAPAVATGMEGSDNLGVAYTGSGTLISGAAQGYFTSDVMVGESNRYMLQANLGYSVADANGQLVVYIDDNANGTANARTWLDGIGVRQSTLLPTAGIVTLNVGGNFTMASGSTLELDVADATAQDQVAVGGTATLAGTLSLNVFNGGSSTPAGTTMALVTSASRSGRFDSIVDPSNRFSLHYNNSRVLAIADQWNNPTAMTGDLDVPRSLIVAGTTPWSGASAKYGAGTVQFTGSQTWANNSTLTIAAGAALFNLDGSDTVTVGTGVSVAINAGATLTLAGSTAALNFGNNRADVANDSQLTLTGGVNDLGNITGAGRTSLNSTAAFIAGVIRQGTVAIAGNSKVTIRTSDANGTAAGVQGASSAVSRITNLSIDTTSRLDLKNNALVFPASGVLNGSAISVTSLRDAVLKGRGATGTGGASWSAAGGIGSSSFTLESANSLGYIWNGDPNLLILGGITQVNGFALSSTDYAVKFTTAGDANLDGIVDNIDVGIIGLRYLSTLGNQWYQGDFNYDGVVNNDDVAIIGLAYNPSGLPTSPTYQAAISESFSAGAGSLTPSIVPEPTSLTLLSLGALGLLRRRRRI